MVLVVVVIQFVSYRLVMCVRESIRAIGENDFSQMFFFDDVHDKRYFFKQFLAGVFTVIAMTGLDQDMMQRNLSCKNFKDSQKNMITSGILQFVIILLFLMLGVLLYAFAMSEGIDSPAKTDCSFLFLPGLKA